MKNILFITDISLKNPIRGTPLRIYNILQQIRKQHKVIVCAKDCDAHADFEFIPYPAFSNFQKLVFFIRRIKRSEIDIVLTSTEIGLKLPLLLKLFAGVKVAVELHGLYYEELLYAGAISGTRNTLLRIITKMYIRRYDLVFVVSEKLKRYYGSHNKNIHVVYGGVNLEEFEKPPPGRDGTDFTIGYMGNSRPYQGVDYLLEAAARIKEQKLFAFRLNMVVSGSREAILQKISEYNLTDSTSLSFDVAHAEVNAIIGRSDVLVIPRPSLQMTEYAFPSKLTEYLATGIPTIVTQVGPVSELAAQSNCFMVIPHENISAGLTDALQRVYRMGGAERRRCGEHARRFVARRLTWNVLGKVINEQLEEL